MTLKGSAAPAGVLEKASNWLVGNILPLGWIALSTGMLWVWDRSQYPRLYYVLLLAPAALVIFLRPARLKALLASPLLIAFILFGAYATLSIVWSNSDTSAAALAKRPLYVLFLFFSGGLLALEFPGRLMFSLKASAIIASLLGVVSLGFYFHDGMPERLSGYGVLDNALISSHVYGYFMAFWLADGFLRKNPFAPVFLFSLFVFGALIIATGSRTPLLALTACSVWLMVVHWNRRSLVLLITIALALGTFLVFYPEGLFSRGTSLRPEIWKTVWPQILEAPWFGHGYNALWQIQMASGDIFFDNPHNLLLGVFYNLGVVGLTLWLSLYIVALTFSWRNRKNPLVIIASTLLVFGFAAGMTEGGAFLSRPKEHWFLIWIPMTLLFASELACKKEHVHTP